MGTKNSISEIIRLKLHKFINGEYKTLIKRSAFLHAGKCIKLNKSMAMVVMNK